MLGPSATAPASGRGLWRRESARRRCNADVGSDRGVIIACVGGIIRDTLAGEPSILLRHEICVTAALAAAGLYILLEGVAVASPWAATAAEIIGMALRGGAIRWGWSLPARGRFSTDF
ncbi:trimeric intracellular cation channel family protein [Sphingopyxis sp. KK2]|uniref:trimeric intracellular cation channel family protein n=1 Tax=Sphingopyxis sp. KK2 TaxID=1855727 RepID=UPI00097E7284|nr:TRIC cation channel family protein [Sphingopyxis sp. KK2]